jgi:SsrA-binding protein
MSKRSAGKPRNIANNRRAWHDYEILDRLECGISLVGSEVKSLRAGRASIGEAYVVFENGEAFLIHAHIPIYLQAGPQNHQTDRKRRLLMSHKQISKWTDKAKASGYTVVPLQLYFKGSWNCHCMDCCRWVDRPQYKGGLDGCWYTWDVGFLLLGATAF